MPLSLESLFDRLKNWFPRTGAEIEAKASKLEAKLTQSDGEFQTLSKEKRQHLRDRTTASLNLPSYRAAVTSALKTSLKEWETEDRTSRNSLAILASPIEPLERIWQDVLETWEGKADYRVRVLQPSHRPQDGAEIADRLREQLAAMEESPESEESPDDRPEIVVIPHLEWYFLRVVEGLDGIEWLQQMMVERPDRFWAVGCNSWAWQYLDCVCQSSAYCDRTLLLPELKAIEIKNWLASICDEIEFDDDSEDDEDDPQDWDDERENWTSKGQLRYFNKLQKTASGLSRVAVELWLDSLCVNVNSSDSGEEDAEDDTPETPSTLAWRKRIDLPDRPALTLDDRHLVYSVLLHGSIDLPHLAQTLGERELPVRARVRVLERSGALWNRKGQIQVNPAYYLRLKTDLENNKFLVSDDNTDD
ncbi:MAG: hypothetical protein SWY16_12480 [Cyanobacteriota bacterium]|nr:hypothetical protein [Cyanobacteriota bacterium]